MKTSFFEQVAGAVKDHSKRSRWLSVVLCLALVVSAGTFYTLIRKGQAKVRTEKLLVCEFVPHEHTDDCYARDEDDNIIEDEIICGYADYVIHTHTDDCYDENGKLVCELEELEAHEHDASCYEVTEVLICDHVEQAGGHQHSDECYEEREIEGEAEGACALEEHTHSDACYTEQESSGEAVLTCGESEHTHNDSCYTETTTMTCGESEHSHSDSCYTTTYDSVLDCSDDSEDHVHDSGCYTEVETGSELTCGESEHSHSGDCYETTRELTCGESEHSHSGDCYSEGEAGTVKVLDCGKEEHTHDASCAGTAKTERVLICEQEENIPDVQHDDSCYESEEELVCGKEEIKVHIHDEKCYDPDEEVEYDEDGNELPRTLICGEIEVQEHIHSKECFVKVTVGLDDPQYICGELSHTHAEGCFGEDGRLRCPLKEHTHGDTCLASLEGNWICGKEAHKHDDACYSSGELTCGLEEHEHSDACLPVPEWLCGKMEHTHDETCRNADGELVCPLEEHRHTGLCMTANAAPDWKCGKIAHTHDESCRDEDGNLICELKEHEHTDFCLIDPNEVSWLCGKTAHTHDEKCYDESGVLVCGLEEHEHTYECLEDREIEWLCGKSEHTHSAACYGADGALVCGLEEHTHDARCLVEQINDEDCICGKIAHVHGDACYDENGDLICELEEHIHTIDCLPAEEIAWLCGKVGHIHSGACYDENGELICGLEEHVHTAACLAEQSGLWFCGKVEHTHGDECYDEDGNLVCDIEEHTHTDECRMIPETVTVTHEHNYTTQSGYFDITFRVEGPAILRKDPADMVSEEPEEVVPVDIPEEENYDVFLFGEEEEDAAQAEEADASPADDTQTEDAAEPEESGREFRFQIDELGEGDETYAFYLKQAEEQEANVLEALSLYLYCDGSKLDLTDCKVTAEIKPTEQLKQMVVAALEQAAADAAAEAAANKTDEDEEMVELFGTDEGDETSESVEPPSFNFRLTAVKTNEEGTGVDTVETVTISSDDVSDVASDGDEMVSLLSVDDAEEASEDGKSDIDAMFAAMLLNMSGPDYDVVLFDGTETNPMFTVMYYAKLDRLVTSAEDYGASTSGTFTREVIDTTKAAGGAVPVNGTTEPKTRKIYVEADGAIKHQTDVITKLFTERTFKYFSSPDFKYFNIIPFSDTSHYKLEALWIAKCTKSHTHTSACWPEVNETTKTMEWTPSDASDASTVRAELAAAVAEGKWLVVKNYDAIHLTNDEDVATFYEKENYIVVDANTVICMMYDAHRATDYSNDAAFYDYDITDGYVYRAEGQKASTTKEGKYEFSSVTGTRYIASDTTQIVGTEQTYAQSSLEEPPTTKKPTSDTANWGHVYAKTNDSRGNGFGINSPGNYKGSGPKLGFGNANTGSPHQDLTYTSNNTTSRLNKWNNKGYKGCAFGLAKTTMTTTTNGSKTIQYNVDAPKLFNDGDAEGKIGYGGMLNFDRNGDTYTLTSVSGDDVGATNLDKLSRMGYDSAKAESKATYTAIATNEFWPLDKAASWGNPTPVVNKQTNQVVYMKHDLRFGSADKENRRVFNLSGDNDFPVSDFPAYDGYYDSKDGVYTSKATGDQDHNSYFGLNFAVDFELTRDYVGPLEYLFFGDDDMWVYLVDNGGKDPDLTNGKLICDIGGVHSTVGEYVDLWDYIKKDRSDWGADTSREYTLYFFYTERGASGSTCWMQFTLPQVSSKPTEIGGTKFKNVVSVGKTVEGSTLSPEQLADIPFEFEISITRSNAVSNVSAFSFTRYKKDGTAYDSEGNANVKLIPGGPPVSFTLYNGECIKIDHLPPDTQYTITEKGISPDYKGPVLDYYLDCTAGGTVNGSTVTGTVNAGDNTSVIPVQLVNKAKVQMPATGGPGTTAYSVIGASLLLGGLLYVMRKKKEE